MKRAIVVTAGTVAGVAAVLALNPDGASVSAGTHPSTAPSGGSGTRSATGDAVDVRWGNVQVQVTLTGDRITDITSVQLPDGDGHSARISERVWPTLVQQAIEAQSSQVAGVSGASFTSYGFRESLKSALLSLGHPA
jgi:uncharacterized protein with FMN-binding domain